MRFGYAVFEICEPTDRQTDINRHAARNTSHRYRSEVITNADTPTAVPGVGFFYRC